MNTYEETMKKHLEDKQELREPRADYVQGTGARTIDGSEYTRQGEYTVDDFYELTKGKKAELIDGVIYDMSSAIPAHDTIVMELGWQIDSFIRGNNGECTLYTTSLDVQLDAADDRDIFEPDLMVICDRNKCNNGPRIIGAPDFIVEILSPATRQKDKTVKLWKYQQAGVREYWIVDPKKLKVIVYTFDPEDGDTNVYSFHDRIPVGIYNGDLVIDFEKIYERVKDMYGIGEKA